VAALKSHIKAPAEPENKGIRIRMLSPGVLPLLPHNLVLLNRKLVVDPEALFLKRDKSGEEKGWWIFMKFFSTLSSLIV